MPEQAKEPEEYPLSKLEEFAGLKLEFDRRFGSLSGAQLFTTVATFVSSLDENPKVYVDAKIEGRHEREGPKQTFVAYFVSDVPSLKGFTKVEGVEETDDAELHAIAFAIDQLKDKLERFTIVCDHESVVSEINRDRSKLVNKRPILNTILDAKASGAVSFETLGGNPAHSFLKSILERTPERGLAR